MLSWFPSPSGVSIFSIMKTYYVLSGNIVSVPFRGFYLLNHVLKHYPHLNKVSVPFRGFYLLNDGDYVYGQYISVSVPFRGFYLLNLGYDCSEIEKRMFPSPSGVSIFSIQSRLRSVKPEKSVSVPFRGFYLLNSRAAYKRIIPYSVSVPFRGFYLLNAPSSSTPYPIISVSVPFRGFYLLNAVPDHLECLLESPVSVPFRGFYLLNINLMGNIYAADLFPSPSGVSIFSMLTLRAHPI